MLWVLEKEMATHSSVLAWRIPGTGEPGGLLSMGSHRVGHDWSDLAAAAAAAWVYFQIRPCIAKHLSFLSRGRLGCHHSQNNVCWKLVTANLLFIKLGNWLQVSLKCQVQTGFQAYSYKKKWDLFCLLKFQLSLLQLLLIGSVTPKWQTKGLRF